MQRTSWRPLAALLVATSSAGGCSIFSPLPLWELTKATGGAVSTALSVGPGKASDTVYHEHAPFRALCIELNPTAPLAELVPALQAELRQHGIGSRVYERDATLDACSVWLRYSAQVEWEVPPFGDRYRAYVANAALTLVAADGRVLSTSRYELDPAFGLGKWSSTRAKLAPVVTALVTGFEN